MSVCRFCGTVERQDAQLVKYGARHYAHHACYLDAGKKLEDLHDWQIGCFPFRLISDRGLMEIAEAAYAREGQRIDAMSRERPNPCRRL